MATSSEGNWSKIPEALAAIHNALVVAVHDATKEVSEDAEGGAPVATGFLRESNYYVTSTESTYSQAVSHAQGIDAHRAVLPEVDHPASDTEGVAAVAASYGLYVEMGTSRAGAQPFLTPAAEHMRGKLPDMAAAALNKALARALG